MKVQHFRIAIEPTEQCALAFPPIKKKVRFDWVRLGSPPWYSRVDARVGLEFFFDPEIYADERRQAKRNTNTPSKGKSGGD